MSRLRSEYKEIDENKPTGSIRIRVETITYSLKSYREDIPDRQTKLSSIEERLRQYEARLHKRLTHPKPAEPEYAHVKFPIIEEAPISQESSQCARLRSTHGDAKGFSRMYKGWLYPEIRG